MSSSSSVPSTKSTHDILRRIFQFAPDPPAVASHPGLSSSGSVSFVNHKPKGSNTIQNVMVYAVCGLLGLLFLRVIYLVVKYHQRQRHSMRVVDAELASWYGASDSVMPARAYGNRHSNNNNSTSITHNVYQASSNDRRNFSDSEETLIDVPHTSRMVAAPMPAAVIAPSQIYAHYTPPQIPPRVWTGPRQTHPWRRTSQMYRGCI